MVMPTKPESLHRSCKPCLVVSTLNSMLSGSEQTLTYKFSTAWLGEEHNPASSVGISTKLSNRLPKCLTFLTQQKSLFQVKTKL